MECHARERNCQRAATCTLSLLTVAHVPQMPAGGDSTLAIRLYRIDTVVMLLLPWVSW
jgi:hypothetical protein